MKMAVLGRNSFDFLQERLWNGHILGLELYISNEIRQFSTKKLPISSEIFKISEKSALFAKIENSM